MFDPSSSSEVSSTVIGCVSDPTGEAGNAFDNDTRRNDADRLNGGVSFDIAAFDIDLAVDVNIDVDVIEGILTVVVDDDEEAHEVSVAVRDRFRRRQGPCCVAACGVVGAGPGEGG